jgi:hypothetical protein
MAPCRQYTLCSCKTRTVAHTLSSLDRLNSMPSSLEDRRRDLSANMPFDFSFCRSSLPIAAMTCLSDTGMDFSLGGLFSKQSQVSPSNLSKGTKLILERSSQLGSFRKRSVNINPMISAIVPPALHVSKDLRPCQRKGTGPRQAAMHHGC